MKKLLLLWLMIAPMSGMAQNESTPQDTTLYVNGRKIVIKEQGDKIKVKLYESASGGDTITNAQIFEGVYLNGQSTESRTVLSALPFSKKNNKRNRFEPHAGGFYIGYTRLSNDIKKFVGRLFDIFVLNMTDIPFITTAICLPVRTLLHLPITGGSPSD